MDSDERAVLARRMAEQFYNIPIAMTVLDGRVYGAYIGNFEPYDLPAYDADVASLAIQMRLFNDTYVGEIGGTPVIWWMSKRTDEEP